jgi:predicted nucleotidyltransferase
MRSDEQRTLQLQSELDRCIALLKARYKPRKIVLFGSLAQGKVGTWSDIDLVIVGNRGQVLIFDIFLKGKIVAYVMSLYLERYKPC